MQSIDNYVWDDSQQAKYQELYAQLDSYYKRGPSAIQEKVEFPPSIDKTSKIKFSIIFPINGGANYVSLSYHAIQRFFEHTQRVPDTVKDICEIIEEMLKYMANMVIYDRINSHIFFIKHSHRNTKDQYYGFARSPHGGIFYRFVLADCFIRGRKSIAIVTSGLNTTHDMKGYSDTAADPDPILFAEIRQALLVVRDSFILLRTSPVKSDPNAYDNLGLPKTGAMDFDILAHQRNRDYTQLLFTLRDNISQKSLKVGCSVLKMKPQECLEFLTAMREERGLPGVLDLISYIGQRRPVPMDIYSDCQSPAYQKAYDIIRDLDRNHNV
jgi:hypothetical protein